MAAMYIANVGGMTFMVAFPAMVAVFKPAWSLSNAELG